MRQFSLLIVLALSSLPVFAAGTCPTGTNYIAPSAPAAGSQFFGSTTLAALGVTNCWYVAANGADTNTGTDETQPFLHAPGMTNCTNKCAAVTVAAGTGIIFRGGDTWHFGDTGQTTSVGSKTWSFSHSGSSGAIVYVGIDPTWFSGGSFARPIFSGDNTITTSRPASCSFDFNNVSSISTGTSTHFAFDGIEGSGFCASLVTDPNAGFIFHGMAPDATIERIYFHGFTVPTTCGTSCFDEQTVIHGTGNSSNIGNLTDQCIWNVFDNSDGSLGTTGSWAGGNGQATLEAIQTTCVNIGYSIFARLSNGVVSQSTSIHDSVMHDLYESNISSVHGNLWNVDNDGAKNIGVQTVYNVLAYNTNEGVSMWFMQTQAGIPGNYFNNVSMNNSNAANCLMIGGTSQSTGLPTGTIVNHSNNTWDAPCNLRGLNNSSDPKQNGTTFFSNDHFIGYAGNVLSATHSCDSGSVCTWTDNGNEIFQSEAVANGQGYTQANFYAPTSGTNSTVGAGANLTSSCSTYSPDSALCSGIPSITESSAWGGKVVSYVAGNPRPSSGSWDTGAYEFTFTIGTTLRQSGNVIGKGKAIQQ